jgi:hypothetical protein
VTVPISGFVLDALRVHLHDGPAVGAVFGIRLGARCGHPRVGRFCQGLTGRGLDLVAGLADVALSMSRFAPNLASEAEQNSGGLSVLDPDRLIKWFIGVVVIGVGVNLLSSFAGTQWWV